MVAGVPAIRTFQRFALATVATLLAAGTAHAQSGVQLPEPSSITLLGLGLAGLLIGRRFAERRED